MECEFTEEVPRAIYIGYSPAFSAYSTKKSISPKALVIEMGHAVTSVLPVAGGWTLDYARFHAFILFSGFLLTFLLDKVPLLVGGRWLHFWVVLVISERELVM